jgi:hypothetical protein
MPMLIKNLRNNRCAVFDQGGFDQWCVYIVESNGSKTPPHDTTYFADLKKISHYYPNNKIYDDFVRIYDQTTKQIDENVLTLIDSIVATYSIEHQTIIEQWFVAIYGGMIAEENKAGAILKKRIKRLGIYQVLVLNMSPTVAANFSRGKKVAELSPLMKSYGF